MGAVKIKSKNTQGFFLNKERPLDLYSLFGVISLGWLALGLLFIFFLEIILGTLSWSESDFLFSVGAFFAIWLLCILDLLAMTKLVSAIFQLVCFEGKNRSPFLFRLLGWGGLKLVCLGLFFITLLKGQNIPMNGLLLGLATLGIVPVIGGFFWSQNGFDSGELGIEKNA